MRSETVLTACLALAATYCGARHKGSAPKGETMAPDTEIVAGREKTPASTPDMSTEIAKPASQNSSTEEATKGKAEAHDESKRKGAVSAPVGTSREIAKTIPTHTWQRGDRLDRIVRERYGIPENGDWTDSFRVEPIEDLVLYHNGFKKKKELFEGTNLRLPSREQLFIQAGLPPELESHLTELFRVESLYYEYGNSALDYMCDFDKPVALRQVPAATRKEFTDMSEKISAFGSAIEQGTQSASEKRAKVLETLDGLYHTFKEIAEWKFDEQYCDFGGKEVTGTKRLFSNLMYRLYKWAEEEKTRGDPNAPQ